MMTPDLYTAARDAALALRPLANDFRVGPDGEGQDILDILEACIEDLEGAVAEADKGRRE